MYAQHPSLPILLLVLLVGIIAALTIKVTQPSIFPAQKNSPPTTHPTSASVKFLTDKQVYTSGETVLVKIILDSPSQKVAASDFVILFDPQYLQPTEIIQGSYFGNYPIKKIETSTIRISGVALLKKNTITAPIGSGIVATVVFRALSPTLSTTVAFDQKNTVVASDGKNILENHTNATLTINPKD